MQQTPGTVYLGNPAVYPHAVYDHKHGPNGRVLSLQCRLGFPVWDEEEMRASNQTESPPLTVNPPYYDGKVHGFYPWEQPIQEQISRKLSPIIAEAFAESVRAKGGLKMPTMEDIERRAKITEAQ